MARFFFDFRQGQERVRDPEGTEFANAEEAFLDTVRAAQEMWSEMLQQRRDPRLCAFEVRDEGGNLLFTFPFQEALDSCTDRKPFAIHQTFDQVFATADRAKRVGTEFRAELKRMCDTLKESRNLLEESRSLLEVES